jgi:RNA polymerase sigma-70 factor, ECF subfamily
MRTNEQTALVEAFDTVFRPSPPVRSFIEERMELALGRWPNLHVDAQDFALFVKGRIPAEEEAEQYLPTLVLDDLFLAHACLASTAGAMQAFESEYGEGLRAALIKMKVLEHNIEELIQHFREYLWVAAAGEQCRLDKYSGRGKLFSWLRIVLVRLASRWMDKNYREQPFDDAALARSVLPDDHSELSIFRDQYLVQFRNAFRNALGQLEAKERNMLMLSYMDNLSIDKLGEIYGVHRATAARWLDKTRQKLRDSTRTEMKKLLGIDSRTLDSVMDLIESRLDVTLGSFKAPKLS